MSRISIVVFAGLMLILTSPVQALADWMVTRTSGSVWLISPDATNIVVVVGQILPDGWSLSTGSDGRAMLSRGVEAIALGPNSQLTLSDNGPDTLIIQPTGTITYDVEPRGVPHFSVETPILAAVVKGTRFVVSVQGGAGSVSVERGVVEVLALANGHFTTLLANHSASLANPTANLMVTGEVPLPPVYQGTPRQPLVPIRANLGARDRPVPPQTRPIGITAAIIAASGAGVDIAIAVPIIKPGVSSSVLTVEAGVSGLAGAGVGSKGIDVDIDVSSVGGLVGHPLGGT